MMKLRAEQINLDSLLFFDLFNRFLKRHLEPHGGSSSILHPPTILSATSMFPMLLGQLLLQLREYCENLRASLSHLHTVELTSFTQLVLRIQGHESTSGPFGVKFDRSKDYFKCTYQTVEETIPQLGILCFQVNCPLTRNGLHHVESLAKGVLYTPPTLQTIGCEASLLKTSLMYGVKHEEIELMPNQKPHIY